MNDVRAKFAGKAALAGTALAMLFATACAGELQGDPDSYRAARSAETNGCDGAITIFESTCSGCHGTESPEGQLDLKSPGLEARLVGHASSDPDCADRVLIDPASPAQSFLLEKLLSPAPECGDPMPQVGALESDELSCIQAWVMNLGTGTDAGATASDSGDAQ